MAVALATTATSVAAVPPIVETVSGPVEGEHTRSGRAQRWLGIPYAAPPVDALRWAAPVAPTPWKNAFRADRYGPACMQIGGPFGPPLPGRSWGIDIVETFGKPVGSEDCLTLNVWRPAHDGWGLPVIVFVHGGANVAGHSADPIYDGERLALAADAVVVTLNYRLGLFGWFAHSELNESDPLAVSGNYGLLDLVAGLRFVQRNARAFGGDPDNVTVMGQSAGAINLYALMASEVTAGLFHKAIPLSGLIGGTGSRDDVLAAAEDFTALLIARDGSAKNLSAARRHVAAQPRGWQREYLRSRAPQQIIEAMLDPQLPDELGAYGDNHLLPVDPEAAFKEGRFRVMPTLVGMTRDEAKLFMQGVWRIDVAERFELMVGSDPEATSTVKLSDFVSPYLLPFLGSWAYDLYSSTATALLTRAVKRSASTLARHGAPVFVYRFDWNQGPEPWRTLYGASHGIDLPFVFGNFSENFFSMSFSQRDRDGREALSLLMMHAIGAFARTGDPNAPGGPPVRWCAWGATKGQRAPLILDASPSATRVSTDAICDPSVHQ